MGEIRPFSSRKSRIWLIIAIVLGAVVIDQVIKILVATHMMLNTGIEITPWFQISYVLNPGMAFGIEWFSKIALTLFRIVAVGLLGWYLHVLFLRQSCRYVLFPANSQQRRRSAVLPSGI